MCIFSMQSLQQERDILRKRGAAQLSFAVDVGSDVCGGNETCFLSKYVYLCWSGGLDVWVNWCRYIRMNACVCACVCVRGSATCPCLWH